MTKKELVERLEELEDEGEIEVDCPDIGYLPIADISIVLGKCAILHIE